jgi:hypothetical protein
MVVSVVVGFLYIFNVSLLCCLVIVRSRKFMELFTSVVGLNCRAGCMLLI